MKHSRLGEILIAYGFITAEQLHLILLDQCRSKIKLGDIVLSRGLINKEQLEHVLHIQETLRSKNKHKRIIALADMAVNRYSCQCAVNKRREVRSKADTISDEYPIFYNQKKENKR